MNFQGNIYILKLIKCVGGEDSLCKSVRVCKSACAYANQPINWGPGSDQIISPYFNAPKVLQSVILFYKPILTY